MPVAKTFESAKLLRYFWTQKKKYQPSYSLRSLSRDLKLSQSYVSEIFSGKKIPSAEKIKKITKLLGMDAFARKSYEESFFKDLFPIEKESSQSKSNKWKAATSGDGTILRQWFYVVVLDLIDCKDFINDPQWIAKRIGIKTPEAIEALNWLKTNKFIAKKGGELSRTEKKIRFHTTRSIAEVRLHHKQMMELAIVELTQKVDKESFDRRLITGITFSCNPHKLDSAKEKLLDAIYSVANELMDDDCSDVYQLNLQLFPHTNSAK